MNETNEMKVALLRERHQALDDEIDSYSIDRLRSPREDMRIKGLKVKRLRLRDIIVKLEESNET
jgi:uncharacterized protein YdcH (DUF465 family)